MPGTGSHNGKIVGILDFGKLPGKVQDLIELELAGNGDADRHAALLINELCSGIHPSPVRRIKLSVSQKPLAADVAKCQVTFDPKKSGSLYKCPPKLLVRFETRLIGEKIRLIGRQDVMNAPSKALLHQILTKGYLSP